MCANNCKYCTINGSYQSKYLHNLHGCEKYAMGFSVKLFAVTIQVQIASYIANTLIHTVFDVGNIDEFGAKVAII